MIQQRYNNDTRARGDLEDAVDLGEREFLLAVEFVNTDVLDVPAVEHEEAKAHHLEGWWWYWCGVVVVWCGGGVVVVVWCGGGVVLVVLFFVARKQRKNKTLTNFTNFNEGNSKCKNTKKRHQPQKQQQQH